ncbi:ion transporter [Streptomyces albus subsp. albus]|nr:ion transporter [Streptomyces albus subsp. albus]
MDRAQRLEVWERRNALPLLAAWALFLTAYAVQVLVTDLSPGERALWRAVTIVTWSAFALDYLVRLALSEDRRRFVRGHWLDLVVVAVPLMRPVRLVQAHGQVLRRRGEPRLDLEAQVMAYAGLSAVLLGFGASLAVLHDERYAAGANIRSFGDALWWACSTVTTTGYGDATPVTPRGRVIGAGLMVVGVALVGAVVASFSSWLLRRFREESETHRAPGGE